VGSGVRKWTAQSSEEKGRGVQHPDSWKAELDEGSKTEPVQATTVQEQPKTESVQATTVQEQPCMEVPDASSDVSAALLDPASDVDTWSSMSVPIFTDSQQSDFDKKPS
jgi:hypothetical protein